MGVNGPEEKRINFAGVSFDANQVSSYGKSESFYYIDFKDGTKVKFAQQNRGASIYSDKNGAYNNHNFNNFDNIFVKGSEANDAYYFNSCKGGSINTCGDQNRDIINIDHDSSNIRVIREKIDDLENQGYIYDDKY